MELARMLEALGRRWPLVLVLALLGGAAGAAHALLSPPRYETSTTVFFSLEGGETVNELAQGSTYTQSLAQSYAEIARLPVVLGPVADELGVEGGTTALSRLVDVTAPAGTSLLEVSATDTSPERAAAIADAVAARVTSTTGELSPGEEDGAGAVRVTTVEDALVPEEPSSAPLTLELLAGLVAGGAVGLGTLLLLEALTTPVSDRAAVARLTGAPVLAEVPRDPRAQRRPVPSRTHPGSVRADAYRVLRTNIRFVQATGGARVVVVTSAVPGAGASGTALNLAAATAELGVRVLLVDADLRAPRLGAVLDLAPEPGLSDVLSGAYEIEDALQRWGSPAVDVLVAGSVPPNPSELLASHRAKHLLAGAAHSHDLVVVDAPALLSASDAAALSALADGAVVVVDSRRTPQRVVSAAMHRLELAGASTLGVVLTRTRPRADQRSDVRHGGSASR
ncbi:polysaccharide biosynthesis tyrosine autokinase [Pseudokineococcus sp. 5B2Z-1]|uniref:polysaccharide biosynthesis tyrosine autokinase n=1 Tax=Pseudokineococcus sp. 5B2Z-1 TaxID=3132744 RepID=UPI00309FDFCC